MLDPRDGRHLGHLQIDLELADAFEGLAGWSLFADPVEEALHAQRVLALLSDRLAELRGVPGAEAVEVEVLVAANGKPSQLSGRTTDNRIVHMQAPARPVDGLVTARIARALPHSLLGDLVDRPAGSEQTLRESA